MLLNATILWRFSLYCLPGSSLDKKCIRLLNSASSNEILRRLRKMYFVIKPLKKVWGGGGGGGDDGTAKEKSSHTHTHTHTHTHQYLPPNLFIGLFLWLSRWMCHICVILLNDIIWIYSCEAFIALYHKDYAVCSMLQGASSLRSNSWHVFSSKVIWCHTHKQTHITHRGQ